MPDNRVVYSGGSVDIIGQQWYWWDRLYWVSGQQEKFIQEKKLWTEIYSGRHNLVARR